MMKNSRKAKRRLKVQNLLFAIAMLLSVVYLGTSIFLRSYNQDMTKQIAQTKQEIVWLKAEVDTITIQIDQLSNQKRVMDIVNDGNMAYIENNIITISN